MKVAMIGSNGLLADEVGRLCEHRGYGLSVYGLQAPKRHTCRRFERVDLLAESIDAADLAVHDTIFYLAGAGIQSNRKESWQAIYGLNAALPLRLAKALQQAGFGGTFVTFGSCFEIGANAAEHLFTEEEVARSELPVPNEYSVSKRLLTRFVRSNAWAGHLHLILPTIYGPREEAHRLIPYTLAAIARGDAPRFTSGDQVRQYLPAGDAARMAFALTQAGHRGGMFNLPGERFTVRELVQTLYKARGAELPHGVFGAAERADASMGNLQLDGSRARAALSAGAPFRATTLEENLKLYANEEIESK